MLLSRLFLQHALPQSTLFIYSRDGDAESFELQDQEVSVAFDSRNVNKNDLFVALKGNRVDGHDFVGQALECGASSLIVASDRFDSLIKNYAHLLNKKLIIVVPDTLKALVELAKAWRNRFSCPIIGVTGSIGKTTTKEILRTIFAKAGRPAHVSYKNQNTEIGLCINLLCMPSDVTVGVFEISLHHKGIVGELADILRPTIGIITCIAHSHVEHIGSLSEVSVQKRQIFKFFNSSDIGIVFGDQELLSGVTYHHPVAKFGFKMCNQVHARKVRVVDHDGYETINFVLKWFGKKVDVVMNGSHRALVNNALAASTVSYFLNIPLNVIVEALAEYSPVEHRFARKQITGGRGTMISDCYNANPESMRAALEAFDLMRFSGHKVAILGDMLELGEKEQYWHRQIGRFITKTSSLNSLILVGDRAKLIAKTAPSYLKIDFVSSWDGVAKILDDKLNLQKSLVLVKGSLGMSLSRVVDAFT